MRTRTSSFTFERFLHVARLIAGDEAPGWLPHLLHSWICDLRQARVLGQERPTRTQMRERLSCVEAAALLIIEELESPWVPEFLGADPNDISPERDMIIRVLEDLADRARRASTSRALATETGATKAGSGRARSAASVSAQTYCAMIILETWGFIHGAEPPPKNHRAAEAAEAYWRAAGGEPHSVGEEPLACWHYHFQLASQNKARIMTAEYRRHLVENDRSWKMLHGLLEEAL